MSRETLARPAGDLDRWYPIRTLTIAHVTVRLHWAGFTVPGQLRRHDKTRLWWWWQVGARGKLTPIDPLRDTPTAERSPTAWQPIDRATWPHRLPEHLALLRPPRAPGQRSPVIEVEPDDGSIPGDGWPHPGLHLGQRTPPHSFEETEARLLRAFRTSASRAVDDVGHGRRVTCADIPSEYVAIALKYAAHERRVEELREGRRPDEAGGNDAVRSGWMPYRRDNEDWLYALGWLVWANERGVEVLRLRAADPAFSYRQIGRALRISAARAHQLYRETITAAMRAAQTNKGD